MAGVLDLADRGVAVTIERRGVRYIVAREPPPAAARKNVKPLFEVDEELLEQGFTWAPSRPGGAWKLAVGPAKKGKRRA